MLEQFEQLLSFSLPGRSCREPASFWRIVEFRGLSAVIPPTIIPQALKQCLRIIISMASNEVDIPPYGFFQQPQHPPPGMIGRHGRQRVGEILNQVKDHGCEFIGSGDAAVWRGVHLRANQRCSSMR